jgi:predicted amidohydrolase YtcJ
VLVLHLCQSAILNRPAVAALGYAKDTPDPPGGQIVRDHAGNPTDVLLATPAAYTLCAALGASRSWTRISRSAARAISSAS